VSDGTEAQQPTSKPAGRSIVDLLTSLRFALVIVALLALACVLGTLLPQDNQVAQYLTKHPEAEKRMALLSALGFTNVFYSWWFAGLLAILAISLTTCSVRRYALARAVKGTARIRVLGSLITHISMLLILAGGVVRGLWGQKGEIEFHEGETANGYFARGKVVPLPFLLHLKKFEIEYYKSTNAPAARLPDAIVVQWAGQQEPQEVPFELNASKTLPVPGATDSNQTVRLTVLQYLPDFFIDSSSQTAKSRSEDPNNPAVQVMVASAGKTNTQWLFARFPDFGDSHMDGTSGEPSLMKMRFFSGAAVALEESMHGRSVKEYRSTVTLVENDTPVAEKSIEVNRPLTYKGYTFYQTGYNPEDPTWTSLQVVRDPGVPIVYAGFILIMVGLTMVFCVSPYLDTHKQKPGVSA
jgi:cytochrome c biogenesis protein ResB